MLSGGISLIALQHKAANEMSYMVQRFFSAWRCVFVKAAEASVKLHGHEFETGKMQLFIFTFARVKLQQIILHSQKLTHFVLSVDLRRRRFPRRSPPSARTSRPRSTSRWSPWTSWTTAALAACTRTRAQVAAEATAAPMWGRAARTAARWTSPPPPASPAGPGWTPWAPSATRCTTASPPAPVRAPTTCRANEQGGRAVVQESSLSLSRSWPPFWIPFSCLAVEGYSRPMEWICR